MKESMAEMITRLNEGLPSAKWIQTSVGVVNTGNKEAAMIAAKKLVELRARQEAPK